MTLYECLTDRLTQDFALIDIDLLLLLLFFLFLAAIAAIPEVVKDGASALALLAWSFLVGPCFI